MSEYRITLYQNGEKKENSKAKNLYQLSNMIKAGFILADREGNTADKIVIEEGSSE